MLCCAFVSFAGCKLFGLVFVCCCRCFRRKTLSFQCCVRCITGTTFCPAWSRSFGCTSLPSVSTLPWSSTLPSCGTLVAGPFFTRISKEAFWGWGGLDSGSGCHERDHDNFLLPSTFMSFSKALRFYFARHKPVPALGHAAGRKLPQQPGTLRIAGVVGDYDEQLLVE